MSPYIANCIGVWEIDFELLLKQGHELSEATEEKYE